jgi:hypothetical protein
MSERIVTEWGRRIDCAKNGCNPPHADDGWVSDLPPHWPKPPDASLDCVINNHATTWVKRTVTYGDWEPLG